jgi:hypothetical protein
MACMLLFALLALLCKLLDFECVERLGLQQPGACVHACMQNGCCGLACRRMFHAADGGCYPFARQVTVPHLCVLSHTAKLAFGELQQGATITVLRVYMSAVCFAGQRWVKVGRVGGVYSTGAGQESECQRAWYCCCWFDMSSVC